MKKLEIILFAILFIGIGILIGKQAGEVSSLTKEIHYIRLVQPINLCGTWQGSDEEGHTIAFTWWPEHSEDVLNLVTMSEPEQTFTLGRVAPESDTFYMDKFLYFDNKAPDRNW